MIKNENKCDILRKINCDGKVLNGMLANTDSTREGISKSAKKLNFRKRAGVLESAEM